VICGEKNPLGLGIRFRVVSESKVEAHWTVSERLQGYTGLLQGGVTAALLDSAMVNCLRLHGIEAYTAEMNVRYLKPIPVGCILHISGHMLKSRKQMHWTEATLYSRESIVATATGKFITKEIHKENI
jgi:uncharacterized protein (TIGR00369 family)